MNTHVQRKIWGECRAGGQADRRSELVVGCDARARLGCRGAKLRIMEQRNVMMKVRCRGHKLACSGCELVAVGAEFLGSCEAGSAKPRQMFL